MRENQWTNDWYEATAKHLYTAWLHLNKQLTHQLLRAEWVRNPQATPQHDNFIVSFSDKMPTAKVQKDGIKLSMLIPTEEPQEYKRQLGDHALDILNNAINAMVDLGYHLDEKINRERYVLSVLAGYQNNTQPDSRDALYVSAYHIGQLLGNAVRGDGQIIQSYLQALDEIFA